MPRPLQAAGPLGRGVAAIVALLALASCSDADEPLDAPAVETTETEGLPPLALDENPCALTSATEVTEAIGFGVRAEFVDGTCRYEVPGLGRVDLRLHAADGRQLDAIAPEGEPAGDFERGARWVAAADGTGGLLYIDGGKAIIEIDADLSSSSTDARARAVAVGEGVAGRLADLLADGGDPPVLPQPEGCDAIRASVLEDAFGTEVERSGEGASCQYRADDGSATATVSVVDPASPGTLDSLARISTADGTTVTWDKQLVGELGDAAVAIVEPDSGTTVELWAFDQSQVVQVTTSAATPEAALDLAKALAAARLP